MPSGRPKSQATPIPRTSPALSNALYIDEILERIFSFLDQPTLKFVAARVSSRWFWIARDLFEHHLILNHTDDLKVLRTVLSQKLPLASKLTVGRAIGPWTDLLFQAEVARWDQMMRLLVQTLSTHSEAGDQERFTRIKALTLNVEHWWIRPDQVLNWFNSRSLKELTIDVPFETGALPMREMLNLCPSLLHLSLSTRKYSRTCRISDESTWIPEDTELQEESHIETWPLRSLRLRDLSVSPTALKSYFSRLQNLAEIYLLEVKDRVEGHTFHDTFHDQEATSAFWLALAHHCQKLKAIHLGCQVCTKETTAIPISLFPNVQNFGIQGTAHLSPTIWKALAVHRVENRLTTLELLGDGPYQRYEPRDPGYLRDMLLHRFLCHSPSLLHLKTGQLRLSVRVLWGDENGHNKMRAMEPSNIWACRRLVTLCLQFESSQSSEGSSPCGASVFGYLTRVCPNVEELSLSVGLQGWGLQSGLCILTRLRLLRSLQICTEGSLQPNSTPLQWRDFAWIQGSAVTAGSQASSLTSLKVAKKLVPSILRPYLFRANGDLKGLLDDYRHCIAAVLTDRGNLNLPNFKQDRERMHRQQKENRFVSDYERPVPMVDGLEDFEFSGSNLDIEAYLQARLFCLQEQQADAVWLPWPHMQQITFTIGYRSNKTLGKHVARGCKFLKACRPDIEVLCRFGGLGT
ncbi:hypothetical protein EMPS_03214 [Entomortierella parvispora]|uniref:F-box domain-containing protein n=1 Tax=Entomortierella parvispora TaxID=205924 RepID=A0A9P3H6C5_9FUNG|nr:hypothetical protein EMPS_03214 [Entomortierella parvispora]